MTDSPDYRKYLEKCFDSIDKKLDEIKAQTTKTNNRVNHLEDKVLELDEGLLKHPIECELTKKVEQIDKDLLEVWFFKKYPKVFLGIITAAVLATLGISYFNKRDNTDIRKNVDYINSVLHIPYAPTRGTVNAYPDTVK